VVTRILRICNGIAIAVAIGSLPLAVPARAEVLTLFCQATSVGGFAAQTYVVDLAAHTIAARPGNLEGHGYGAVPADVGESQISWSLMSGSVVVTRRIDRHTGDMSTSIGGRLAVSGWFCQRPTR
jgi:hypothetical protein